MPWFPAARRRPFNRTLFRASALIALIASGCGGLPEDPDSADFPATIGPAVKKANALGPCRPSSRLPLRGR